VQAVPRLLATLLVAGILADAATVAAQATIDFRSRELQEGRGYLQTLITSPTVGAQTGGSSNGFGFALPPGRGITPSLAVTYASGRGFSYLGHGWDLGVPMIVRGLHDGIPTYDDAVDTFELHEGGASSELVDMNQVVGGWRLFRERTEKSFSRYLFQPSTNRWRVLRRDGSRLELGSSTGSRAGRGPLSTSAGTAVWFVERIVDSHGNYAAYSYAPAADGNALLRRIDYSGNLVTGDAPKLSAELTWTVSDTPRGQRVVSYRAGYRQEFGLERLTKVTVRAPVIASVFNPAKVPASTPVQRSYAIRYQAADAAAGFFRIAEIQTEDEPPTVFTYSDPWASGLIDTGAAHGATGAASLPNYLGRTWTKRDDNTEHVTTKTQATLVDVTGDALADLVDTSQSCGSDGWLVWQNDGGSFVPMHWAAPVAASGTSIPDPCALRVSETSPPSTTTRQDFLDLTGDSLPDFGYWSGANLFVCRGNGHGFDACTTWGPLPADVIGGTFRHEMSTAGLHMNATDADMIDVNGDGLVDRVSAEATSNGQLLKVVLNDRGQGWGALVTLTMPACPFAFAGACLRLTQRVASTEENRIGLADLQDVNGDGLVDFLTDQLDGSGVRVAWGTGTGFSTTQGLDYGPSSLGTGHQSEGGDYRPYTDLLDVNGDHLADVISFNQFTAELSVRFNRGGYWDPSARVYTLSASPTGVSYDAPGLGTVLVHDDDSYTVAVLADVTGDGIADFVSAAIDSALPSGDVWVRELEYRAPRLMTGTSALDGHRISEIRYAPEVGVPFPLHTVASTLDRRAPLFAGEPTELTEHLTRYRYKNPYFDPVDRELRGFLRGYVQTTELFTETTYHLGKHDAGLPESSTSWNLVAQGVPRHTEYGFGISDLGSDRGYVHLDRLEVIDADLLHFNMRRSVTDYIYYGPDGQLITWIERGDTSSDTDDVGHFATYVLRDDVNGFLIAPSAEYTYAGGKEISQTRYFYDDRVNHGVVPTRGNLVRVQRRREKPGEYVEEQSYFDDEDGVGFGLMTSHADPEQAETTYSYDPTLRQYQVVATDGVGTTYHSYHALTGAVAETCGPQHLAGSYPCDVTEIDALGRTTLVWVARLTGSTYSTSPRKVVAYNDHAYPLTMTVTTIAPDGVIGTAVQYRDGFGNPTEVRTEERAGVYRVREASYDPLGTARTARIARLEDGPGFTHEGNDDEAYHYSYDRVRGDIEQVVLPREPGGPTATVTRLDRGDAIIRTDELGRATEYRFDSFGRVAAEIRHGGAAGHALTTYEYDGNGAVTRAVDPNGLVTAYTHNLLGWLLTATTPDGKVTSYQHDRRGAVVSTVDPLGTTTTNVRDPLGRVTRTVTGNEPPGIRHVDVTTTYFDNTTGPSQLGWIASQTNDGITRHYAYDPHGNPVRLDVDLGTAIYTVETRRDYAGRVIRTVYPDGRELVPHYNRDDSLDEIVGTDGAIYASVLYEAEGKPSVVGNDFGLDEALTYDLRGRLHQVVSANTAIAAGPLVDDTFGWSAASDLISLTRSGLAVGGTPRWVPEVQIMTNDGLGRLRHVTRNGDVLGDYAYDIGGRLTAFAEQGEAFTYTYSVDKLLGRTSEAHLATYSYDGAGQATSDQLGLNAVFSIPTRTRSHTWDGLGRYVQIDEQLAGQAATRTSYVYADRSPLRIRKYTGSTLTSDVVQLDQWATVDLVTGKISDRVIAAGMTVAELTGAEVHLLHRTLGSTVAAVSSSSGAIVRQEEFRPYGAVLKASGADSFEEHFHGLRRDQLTVAGGRPYDAEAGRWLSRDRLPLGSSSASLQSGLLDAYGFVADAPYRGRDPSGMAPDPVAPVSGGVVTPITDLDGIYDLFKASFQLAHDVAYGSGSVIAAGNVVGRTVGGKNIVSTTRPTKSQQNAVFDAHFRSLVRSPLFRTAMKIMMKQHNQISLIWAPGLGVQQTQAYDGTLAHTPGKGSAVVIWFDPDYTNVHMDELETNDSDVGLIHEYGHAFHIVHGLEAPNPTPGSAAAGKAAEEDANVGLSPPTSNRWFTENAVRSEAMLPLRKCYDALTCP